MAWWNRAAERDVSRGTYLTLDSTPDTKSTFKLRPDMSDWELPWSARCRCQTRKRVTCGGATPKAKSPRTMPKLSGLKLSAAMTRSGVGTGKSAKRSGDMREVTRRGTRPSVSGSQGSTRNWRTT
jgi:hypothetical protein